MRIISGKYRGKILISPKDDSIRPTMDRAKEALFNMIQNDVFESRFLDLFSGTGSIAIEAFSRGASQISIVEKNKQHIQLINSNLNLIPEKKENVEIIHSEVIDFLKNTDKKYDIIFADPPYTYDKINDMIKIVSNRNILDENGVFIIETDRNCEFEVCKTMRIEKEKMYSISKFTLIRCL